MKPQPSVCEELPGARRLLAWAFPLWSRSRLIAAIKPALPRWRGWVLPGFAPQKSRGELSLPPHIPASPRAYSLPVPQADTLKASPCSVVCVLWVWYPSEWTVGVINAPAMFLPTCCRSSATGASHPPSPASSSPSLPAGARLQNSQIQPCSLLNRVLFEMTATDFIWIGKKTPLGCASPSFARGQAVPRGLCNRTHEERPEVGYWSVTGFKRNDCLNNNSTHSHFHVHDQLVFWNTACGRHDAFSGVSSLMVFLWGRYL